MPPVISDMDVDVVCTQHGLVVVGFFSYLHVGCILSFVEKQHVSLQPISVAVTGSFPLPRLYISHPLLGMCLGVVDKEGSREWPASTTT